jgi:hypothetical protein
MKVSYSSVFVVCTAQRLQSIDSYDLIATLLCENKPSRGRESLFSLINHFYKDFIKNNLKCVKIDLIKVRNLCLDLNIFIRRFKDLK